MVDTFAELMEYLDMRGAKYGIDGMEILEEIPESVRDPKTAYEYMQLKDISHKIPLSHGGDPAGDNWILEDSSVNRARGAEIMTSREEALAEADAHEDARKLKGGVILGSGLALGGAIIEGAIVAAEVVTVVPALVTLAGIGGAAYGTHRLIKHAKRNDWLSKAKTAATKAVVVARAAM